ncbi:(p)ppGpp synthetase, putative [Babesia caballi]|uniref:(P)ppGpp synthetase, putative n=1 Tax=Babesia caballi TaxID=5871 RepID=A0AAV4LZP3_BABCB|nr:(p)ppGpp synthetase, putative [Babesia caballi]
MALVRNLLYICVWHAALRFTSAAAPGAGLSKSEDAKPTAENITHNGPATGHLSIPFEVADYLPAEPESGEGSNVCRRTLNETYQASVQAILALYDCNIHYIGNVKLTLLEGRIFDKPSNNTSELAAPDKKGAIPIGCVSAKLAAHCPTYLSYADCVFKVHVASRNKNKNVKIPVFPLRELKFDARFMDYLERFSDSLSPLLDETLLQLCRFVITACSSLHPEFEDTVHFKEQHICSVLDVLTPLKGFDSLYDPSLPEEERLHLKETERQLYGNQFYVSVAGLVYSPLGAPYDIPMNIDTDIKKYSRGLCEKRCEYLKTVKELTSDWSKLSAEGYKRQVMICAKLLVTCEACDACAGFGIDVQDATLTLLKNP